MAESAHVSEDRLLAFTLGHLDEANTAEVQRHLEGCDACRAQQQSISSGAFSKTSASTQKEPAGSPTRVDGAGALGTLGLARGSTLGRYVLIEKLGAGGMGEVFAAYDPQLDRKVAVKLLRGGALSAQEGKARLLREAQAMARLQHPNVVAVHDVGVIEDRVFIAMEYVEGETLDEWLREKRTWQEVVRSFLQSGSGLAAAHRAGLIHRDFKPENVLVGKDARPRVVDFGLARQSSATPAPPSDSELETPLSSTLARQLTRDGAVMGTPGYMAPEQISGLVTDARSDQFAFCVALWEALFGRRPFSGSTLRQLAAEIEAGKITPPPSDSRVPSWVTDVARRGLKANPAERWPDMDALLRELRPRARTNPRRVLFVVGLVLFSLFGIGYGVWTRQVCGGTEVRLRGLWDTPRKARLRAAFAATGLSYAPEAWARAERTLDTWAAEWVVASRDVCEASQLRKTDSPELTALKDACLEERLGRLQAVLALFETPDPDVVNSAPLAARDLDSATSCTSPAGLRRRDGLDQKERAAEAALRVRLAEARALYSAGKYASAAERLEQGLSPDVPPASLAEAQLWLARMLLKGGSPDKERLADLRAAEQALKAGESGLAARAFARLAASEVADANEEVTNTWKRLAQAAAARVASDWEVQVELAQSEGFVELKRKKYKPALEAFERVLELQQQHLGTEHPDVATTLNNLGAALTGLKEPLRALELNEESLRLHEKLEGPDHPNVASALSNLALILKRLGRSADARAAWERALSIRRQALGPTHPDTLRTTYTLAKLLIELGELEPAGPLVDGLREARSALNSLDAPEMLPVFELQADLYLAGAYWKEAAESATRRLTIARARGAAGQRDVVMALLDQSAAWTKLGAWNDARKAVTEAAALINAKPDSDHSGQLHAVIGSLELAQGHQAAGRSELNRAIDLFVEESDFISAGLVALESASALRSDGQAAEALAQVQRAETFFTEQQAARHLVEAQLFRAQLMVEVRPEAVGEAVTLLQSLEPRFTPTQRALEQKWLSEHDAGTP